MRTPSTFYLAGPMRGKAAFNFPAFDHATASLRRFGWQVVSPAEHDREIGLDENNPNLESQGFSLDDAFAWDLSQIEQVDAVALLPGWEHSAGCKIEIGHARRHSKPVYEYIPNKGGSITLRVLGATE